MPRWWPIGSCDARVRGRVSIHSLENPPLRLQPACGGSRVYGCDCDLVAKLAKCSRQHLSAFLLSPGIRFAALLDKSHPLMQDLPNHTLENPPLRLQPTCGAIRGHGC